MPTDQPQNPATSQGDGASPTAPAFTDLSTETSTAAVEKAMPTPAVADPVKAAVSAPIPASYEMPDDYATESLMDKTKEWVEQNPALALLAAAGIGLVVGRLATALIPKPKPETLVQKVEARADELSKEARKQAKRMSAEAKSRAKKAGAVLSERFEDVSEAAEEGIGKSRELADHIADAVKVAVAGVAAKKVEEWVARAKR